jgi:uncharacterized small protein (DUF1192 family)
MFASPVGRARFFVYSAISQIAELIFTLFAIFGSMGFEALLTSKPGPDREPLAWAVLIVGAGFVVIKGNLAWRRMRDAQTGKGMVIAYIIFSFFFALLQAGEAFVHDFNGDTNSGSGLGLLGIGITILWATILMAKPASGNAASSQSGKGARGWSKSDESASALSLLSDAELVARAAALKSERTPSNPKSNARSAASPVVSRTPGGFGHRGLT